jgi:hypothetical protein
MALSTKNKNAQVLQKGSSAHVLISTATQKDLRNGGREGGGEEGE